MTRINVVPVEELNDKMLLAEYRELPRISKLARFPKEGEEWPTQYVLGKSHCKFFYTKGEYLRRRFEEQIVSEMQRRGFTTNYTTYRLHADGLNNDWEPTEQAMEINRERIRKRLEGK
jgi:hypothetical protein